MAWVRRNCRQLVSVCRRRRWWDPVALQDPPDRRGADAVAECEQLALESLVSPARVLPRHPHHQGGEDVVDRWPSGPVGVGPSSADEAAMPAQDRVRGDQAMAHAVLGAAAGRARRTRPGPPSPGAVAGWCGAGRRPRGAARGARRPWRRTCGPAAGPARAPAGRSSTAAAATRRDHVRPSDHRWSATQARLLAPHRVRSCFAVFVDQVPAAAQAARTARVSCGVACSGHGLRNLAAMMTRRSLTAMSS